MRRDLCTARSARPQRRSWATSWPWPGDAGGEARECLGALLLWPSRGCSQCARMGRMRLSCCAGAVVVQSSCIDGDLQTV